MTDKKRKVGIMGGTFDPIHIGHLILAENACLQFQLEKVLFMPSGNPPHKKNRVGRADTNERLDMVSMAIADNPHFELSLAEAFEEGYCYTKETLERLNLANPNTEYYFIMGADSLFSFETWKSPQEICNRCILVAAVRDHIAMEELHAQIALLCAKYHARIELLDTPNIDISSHNIRSWIRTGKRSLRYYVPNEVIAYIDDRDLYIESEE